MSQATTQIEIFGILEDVIWVDSETETDPEIFERTRMFAKVWGNGPFTVITIVRARPPLGCKAVPHPQLLGLLNQRGHRLSWGGEHDQWSGIYFQKVRA